MNQPDITEDIKQMFTDIDTHLLNDYQPSKYLNSLLAHTIFSKYPFSMLEELTGAQQSPIHHPEGNAWNHTVLVVDNAALVKEQSHNDQIFMWAALLHDIGKVRTTRIQNGKITAYNHDIEGEKMAREFLSYFLTDKTFINEVCALIRYHMHVLYVLNNLPFHNIEKMKEETDIQEIALLGFCDRMGRISPNEEKIKKEIQTFLDRCK